MERTKYHRTYHFPWSFPNKDDKVITDLSCFQGKEVWVGIKMDGECTTGYPDGSSHARSLDSRHNFTQDWFRRMLSVLRFDIPENHRFVFENVAYYHSIDYDDLDSFAYLLSVWEGDWRLSYDECKEFAARLDLAMPEELYRGTFDERLLRDIAKNLDTKKHEGYVVTTTDRVHINDINQNIAKFVREGHVQPNADGKEEHWLKRTYPNKLTTTRPVKPYYMG